VIFAPEEPLVFAREVTLILGALSITFDRPE